MSHRGTCTTPCAQKRLNFDTNFDPWALQARSWCEKRESGVRMSGSLLPKKFEQIRILRKILNCFDVYIMKIGRLVLKITVCFSKAETRYEEAKYRRFWKGS